ncbi:hypothetical protein [Actinomycetospora cinnamomea]|uniref:Uncharacterized protein n=1 Tax=Actinomycetospora cinnamomea TaxID=663609 RepID=A0A2U1F496_9PSEU|nr:hypothetical protein [Actinomycetospora cinnamomea]PVZ06850.1 hypothetical protein C8D89_11243 [Actinomycetospora cinnamomea]
MAVRRIAVVAVLLAGLGACANGPGPSTTVPTVVPAIDPGPPPIAQVVPPAAVRVDGVHASIEFVPASERALDDDLIELKTEEPTLGQLPGWKDGSDTAHLPITEGELLLAATPPRGHVRTEGMFMLSRQGSNVQFEDLEIDLDAARVTGTVEGRPITVFDLDVSRARVEDLPSLPPMVVDVDGRMSEEALRELQEKLGAGLTPEDTRVGIVLRLRPVGS